MNATPYWTETELARRRSASRRLAWAIGAIAIAIYSAAFWFR